MPLIPERSRDDHVVWENLSKGLFEAVKRAVAGHLACALDEERRILATWVSFTEGHIRRQQQFDVMTALLWCASTATASESALDGLSRHGLTQSDRPAGFTDSWLLDCVRELRPDDRKGQPPTVPEGVTSTVEVPIALCEANGLGTGIVVPLAIELRSGTGEIFQHPEDCLTCCFDPAFSRSIRAAWGAATTLADRLDCDARWHLVLPEDVREVGGNSASGSVARCAWYGLTGRVPDPEVIVFAAVDASGRMRSVSGIPSKTAAVARRTDIDTIVVAHPEDATYAERRLSNDGAFERIRVIDLTD